MVSLAGPLSNLVLGGLLIVSIECSSRTRRSPARCRSWRCCRSFAFVLNILPIPGLDGWGAIEPYLSPEAQRFGAKARPWAPLILFVAIIGVPGVGRRVLRHLEHRVRRGRRQRVLLRGGQLRVLLLALTGATRLVQGSRA